MRSYFTSLLPFDDKLACFALQTCSLVSPGAYGCSKKRLVAESFEVQHAGS
jgi:hypothetical protein